MYLDISPKMDKVKKIPRTSSFILTSDINNAMAVAESLQELKQCDLDEFEDSASDEEYEPRARRMSLLEKSRKWFRSKRGAKKRKKSHPASEMHAIANTFSLTGTESLAKSIDRISQISFDTNKRDVSETLAECPICLENVSKFSMFLVRGCFHRFCVECINQYVNCEVGQLKQDCVIYCPMSGCDTKMKEDELAFILSESEYQRYQLIKGLREEANDPNTIWCPRPGCSQSVNLTLHRSCESDEKKNALFVRCPSCAMVFCSKCHASSVLHRALDYDCNTVRQLLDESLSELSGDIKRCPNCQVPVSRDGGCAQMQCGNCRHMFCWWCLGNLNGDVMLLHYSSGNCVGRLGHSRPNMLWHQFSAVVIVTGAGMTLITLSPLLFVVMPIYAVVRKAAKFIKKRRIQRQNSLSSQSSQQSSSSGASASESDSELTSIPTIVISGVIDEQ